MMVVTRTMKDDERPPLVVIVIGLFAGIAATLVTNVAQKPLSSITPDGVDQQEKRVRPGATSSLVAARKSASALGVHPSRKGEERLGRTIHIGVGAAWGPVYGLLRRYGGLRSASAALATGAAMSLVLDEGLVPAFGLSAPNHHYPAFTRARGVLAHLVYGAADAVATEVLGRMTARPPWRR